MPKITIELTNTQAAKVMVANGWKPEELGVIVKRLAFEYISATAAPVAPVRSLSSDETHRKMRRRNISTMGLVVLVTSGDA